MHQYCAIIPFYDEANDFFDRVRHHIPANTSILWILIANCPDNAPQAAIEQTRKTLGHLETLGQVIQQANPSAPEKPNNANTTPHYLLSKLNQHQSLLLLDRTQIPLPAKHGVGLARKIGNDLACQLMVLGKLPIGWLAQTDADAQLPSDYFLPQQTHPMTLSGLIYPFTHTLNKQPQSLSVPQKASEQSMHQATLSYEAYLNDYVNGLSYAQSPYAYHSLGSILALNPLYYCQARGFAKRAAGEDFYTLNKLNKLAPLLTLQTPKVELMSRRSHRVPFGTGPRVAELIDSQIPLAFYHPQTFAWLKRTLQLFKQLADLPSDQRLSSHLLREPTHPIQAKVLQLLQQLKFQPYLPKLNRQYPTCTAFHKACHDWFDAFRTLKFIHLIRDQHLPPLSQHQAQLEWTHLTQETSLSLNES